MKTAQNDTREHILTVGHRLIAQKGFVGVGLAEILQQAGVPKGSFYHYFSSKEQFGHAVIERYFDDYVSRLSELFGAAGRSARERLMAYWQYLADTQKLDGCGEQKCLVVKLSAEVADLSESMRTALLDGYRRVIALIAQCMREGMTDGSLPARLFPELDAQNLYHLWLGASLANKLTKDGVPLSAAMRHTEQMLAM
ncbi:MAG: TetR/AcrR family transcriptional regulator [Burkholderiaceae bacterium]